MRYAARLMPAVLSAMILTACVTTRTTETGEAEVACSAFAPISFSATRDTAQTVREVREHNAAWHAVCGEEESSDGKTP